MTELDIVQATGKPYGVDEALSIYTSKVDLKHSVQLKSQFGSPYYGKNWSYPPEGLVEVDKTKALLMEYKKAIIVIGDEGKMDLKKFRDAMIDIEKKLQLNDFPRAFSIINGPCKLCDLCTKVTNKPCKYPEKLRPSAEAMGIDLMSTLRKFKRNCDQTMKGIEFPAIGLVLLE